MLAGVRAVSGAGRGAGGPLVAERLSDRLAARLSDRIRGGALQPGDRLPTEAQLSAEHGVSRATVREAVHQLKSLGLVVSRQGAGVFVAPPPVHRPLDFDPQVLEDVGAVLHVVEIRRVLETEMAALAAQRATRTQVAALKRALGAIDKAVVEGRDGVAEDMAFHRAIADCCGNPQFGRILGFLGQYLHDAMRVTRGNEARRADFMQQVREEHQAMVDAIAARDASGARRATLRHIANGERRLEEGGVVERQRRSRR